jgi:hypothetical protein
MAQSGQLRGRVSESQLIELLEQVCVALQQGACGGSLTDGASRQMEGAGTAVKKESKILVCSFRMTFYAVATAEHSAS